MAAGISTWYAQQNSDIGLARQLAAQALNHLHERHDLALLRSLESYRIADTVEARNSLLTALQDKPALLAYVHEYRSKIYDITFSPDGRMLASVNESGTILLWDSLTNRTKTCQASDKKIAIRSISFNFDGSMLALSGWQKRITFWDPISCRSIGMLTGDDTPISTVAFHPKRTVLAAGSADGTIRIWRVKEDIGNSDRIDLLEGHESPVWDIVFSPDGATMASSGWDERVILWTAANNAWERITLGEPLTGYSLAFSPDNTKLAVGRSDRVITTFDIKTQKRVDLQTTDHKQAISALAFSADGNLLASASQDGLIAIWDVYSHRELGKYIGHTATVWSLAFNPKAPILASGGWDNRILLWETRTPQILGQPFWSAAIGRPGRTLSLGCDDGSILLWDLEANHAVGKFKAHQTAVSALAFCPNKNILASGSGDSTIIIWEVSGEGLIKRNMLSRHEGSVWALAFSHDGTMLASGSSDTSVILWNVNTGELIDRLHGHRLAVSSVAFSSKNRALLATGSWDKDVLLWNILTRKQIGKLSAHESPVSTVAFSPDGTVLATGGWDRKIMLWNQATKQQISSPLIGHQGPISSVTFSGDGAFVASASWDKSVILWDVAKHEQLGRPFLVHKGIVSAVAFCPDNEYFVSCGLDGSVCMYDGSFDRWRARAHRILRNVKREELLRDFRNDTDLEHRGFLTVLIREDTSKTTEESPLILADQNLRTYEESVQVGDYVQHNMQAPLAGLVDQARSTIGEWDNEESFDLPNHEEADFLWFTAGSVSWDFPIDVSAKSQIQTVSFKIEIASEAAAAQWDWPSDVALKINEIDVGTWTVMGDPDGRYGVARRKNHLPPLASQYGWLTTWTIGKSGTYLEYESRFCSMPKMKISNISIDQINVKPGRSLRVTLKVLGDHGLSIFGDSWGDYPYDPIIIVKYCEGD